MQKLLDKLNTNDTFNIIYDKYYSRIDYIYNIFKEFYGEERVDIEKRSKLLFLHDLNAFIAIKLGELDRELYKKTISDDGRFNLKNIEKEEDLNTILTLFSQDENVLNFRRDISNISFIYIHYPYIKITNEEGKSHDIYNLYTRVSVNNTGNLNDFKVNRSEYTENEIYNRYIHSHIQPLDLSQMNSWKYACLGSGPINSIISTLRYNYEVSIISNIKNGQWELFCWELDRFFQVESLSGGPYRYLREINTTNIGIKLDFYTVVTLDGIMRVAGYIDIKEFIKYVIKSKKILFTFKENTYTIAMSPEEYLFTISNLFIDYYNETLKRGTNLINSEELEEQLILNRMLFKDNQMFYLRDISSRRESINMDTLQGLELFRFKGNTIRVNITNNYLSSDDRNFNLILNPDLAYYVLSKILNIINLKYGRNENKTN